MFDHSDELRQQLEQLQRENAELRARITHLEGVSAEQQATLEQLQEVATKLSEENKLLRKALFGRRRERYIPSPDQLLLFSPESLDEEQSPVAEDGVCGEESSLDAAGFEETSRKKRRRKKRNRFEFPQCLPVKRVDYPLPEEEQLCPCGCGARCVIKEVVTRRLEMVPASAYVLEQVRYTYAPQCRQGEHMVTPPKPPSVNEKGVFGPSVLAYLGHMKYERHLPLYRLQEELESISSMWFSRGVLSGALLRTAASLQPLWDLTRMELLESFYLRIDETTARVLRPGTGKTGIAYLWAYVGDDEHPFQLFDFHLNRSRAGPQEILGDFRGGILSDGHTAYQALIKESEGLLLDLACWAHARRKFDEASVVTSHPLVHEVLAWTWQLYDIEDRMAEASAAARLEVRQREAVPILNRMHARLLDVRPTLRPSSKLAEAVGYCLNRWEAFTAYTRDGRYAIDNNAAERMLRPTVIGRKNYLFFGSDDGGEAASVWYTLIQSARNNHVQVLPYLNDILVRLPEIVPEYLTVSPAETPFASLTEDQREALRQLLPDRWLAAHPAHRSEERQRELEAETRRRRKRRARRRLAWAG